MEKHPKSIMLNIVVVGASYAGLSLTHHLLRYTIPSLRTTQQGLAYKVILVAPSNKLYWNLAAPRALCSAALIDDDELFVPFLAAFAQYDETEFVFIQGRAIRMSTPGSVIDIEVLGGRRTRGHQEIGRVRQVEFHALVIATGTCAYSSLLSLHGPSEKTVMALNRFRARIRMARSIMIVGGGPSGVQCAGQIATWVNGRLRKQMQDAIYEQTSKDYDWASDSFAYRHKSLAFWQMPINIILVSGNQRLLPNAKPSMGEKAERQLRTMGVDVMHGIRLLSAQELPNRTTRCIFTQNITITTDMFIPATGTKPNTSFVPAKLLDAAGYVVVDEHLRISGASRRVYAIGSCCSLHGRPVVNVSRSKSIMLHNMRNDLLDWQAKVESPVDYEVKIERLEDKAFENGEHDTLLCPITRWGGVGSYRNRELPSLAVWWLKGRNYNVSQARQVVHSGKIFQ